MAKASIAFHREETSGVPEMSADAVSLVVETIAAIGMSDKEACLTMRFDQSQFSKVKQGQARLPIDALWHMPDRFWAEFGERVRVARGMSPENERRQVAARIGELVKLLIEEVA